MSDTGDKTNKSTEPERTFGITEARMHEILDAAFAPMEKANEEFWQTHQRVEANPSRPALQAERNSNDDFQRILQDFPWVN